MDMNGLKYLSACRQLSEASHVLQAMWTQEEAIFEGNYYQVHGAINQPKAGSAPRHSFTYRW